MVQQALNPLAHGNPIKFNIQAPRGHLDGFSTIQHQQKRRNEGNRQLPMSLICFIPSFSRSIMEIPSPCPKGQTSFKRGENKPGTKVFVGITQMIPLTHTGWVYLSLQLNTKICKNQTLPPSHPPTFPLIPMGLSTHEVMGKIPEFTLEFQLE